MARLDGLERRIGTLEAQQPPVKSDTQKFLEKCTDEELRRLHEIIEKGYDELDKLPPEDRAFIEDLEARYGHW
jgi:hypothetical protein